MKYNRISKRLTAILLSAVFLFTGMMQAFAWNPGTGEKCGSKIGAQYLASDGRNYMDIQEDYYCLHYHPDGSTTVDLIEGRYKVRRHLVLVNPNTKEEKWVYCVEAGTDFDISQDGYLSDNAANSEYFLMLPYFARIGIMSVLLYGYREGQTIPIAGLNADDAFYAGQILIWEYQQGIRTDAGARKDNGKIKADIYYNLIKGRPAEKMYHYLLEKIRKHSVIPSFASRNREQAPTYTLAYDSSTGKYSTTLTDTNNTGESLQQLTKYGLTITHSGNQYTITADKPIDTAVRAEFRKDIPVGIEKLLVWGRPGYQTVCTGADDPITFYLNIKTESFGSLNLKKSSEDGKVSGVPFRITGKDTDKTVTTNSAGEILIDELRSGVYTITEQVSVPYEPQESQRVTIVPGRTTTVTFHNTLKRGDLKVTKTSEDGLNAGVRFQLSGIAMNGASIKLYAVTDSKGIALFEDVPISKEQYVLEEVDTGIRYIPPSEQYVTIKWNEVTNASVTNTLKKWRATVTKSDRETGTAQGDAFLKGAIYGVYKGNQLIKTYNTDARGQFVTDWYPCGNDWTIREQCPGEGYLLDPTIYPVGAEPENFTIERNEIGIDVKEQAVKGKISILKHNDDGLTGIETPEAGAEFQIYLKSAGSYDRSEEAERDTLVCDENGFAESKLLPYGRYTVHQTGGWDGRELMEDFDVSISEDGKIYRYLINNATFQSLIRIEKWDAESGKVIPVSGFGFRIRNKDTGEYLVQHINYPTPADLDTFYTDSTGMLMLPEPLDYGNYELIEVCIGGAGYVLSSEPVSFTVDGTEKVVTVVKQNMAQKGKILIHKTGEVFSSVIEQNGFFQPVYSMKGLDGTVYEIAAKEDIYTPDRTLRYQKGTVVDTITTREGYAESKPLYLGSYLVTEKTASHGMVIHPEPHEVSLQYAGETVEVTVTETSFVNERQKVKINLKKCLEQNNLFGIGRNREMQNVSFRLYADEDIVAADGSNISKGGLIELAFADEKGEICFTSDLPFGRYYLKEYTTDSHYQISEEKYPFVFAYAGQDTALMEISINDGKPIENKLIRGNIHGKKSDEDGFTIAGAVFGLFKSDETVFTEGTALMTAKSNEIGVFGFFDVPYGEYLVRELSCPPAFVLSEKLIPVAVSAHNAVIELEAVNRFVTGSVKVIKQDSENYMPISGVVFGLYDENGHEIRRGYTGEDGVLLFEDIRYGRYALKELKAKDGYRISADTVKVDITQDGQLVEMTLTNEKIPEIPKTGVSIPWLWVGVLTVSGGLMILSALILYFGKKKK